MGVHTGPALKRAGDWWGGTVNLAARVAGTAEADQLLVTEATKVAAGDMASARLRGLGPRHFKNIPLPIQVYAASVRSGGRALSELRELPPGGDT